MKTILSLSLIASLALLAGCDKAPQATTPNEVVKPTEITKPAIEKTVPAMSNDAAAVPPAAAAAAAEVHAAPNAVADSIIDQAKALIGQSKYTEALSALQQLSGIKLTDSQTTLVNSLKEQVQKAMAAKIPADAAGAASGLLPK